MVVGDHWCVLMGSADWTWDACGFWWWLGRFVRVVMVCRGEGIEAVERAELVMPGASALLGFGRQIRHSDSLQMTRTTHKVWVATACWLP